MYRPRRSSSGPRHPLWPGPRRDRSWGGHRGQAPINLARALRQSAGLRRRMSRSPRKPVLREPRLPRQGEAKACSEEPQGSDNGAQRGCLAPWASGIIGTARSQGIARSRRSGLRARLEVPSRVELVASHSDRALGISTRPRTGDRAREVSQGDAASIGLTLQAPTIA